MAELNTIAMLADLHISIYAARKFDKKATKEVSEWHNTDEKVGRYSKRLFAVDGAESHKAIGAAATAAREAFKVNTLPWLDSGSRILTSANFLPCTELMRKLEREFRGTIPIFLQEYPMLKARAKVALNGLYREEDYPTLEKLKDRFAFELKFYPLPDSKDFRAQIRDEDIEAIKKQIDFDTKATINKAMEEPYRRLFDGVAHMASRLNGAKSCPCRNCKGKSFKTGDFGDSLVDNLREMCPTLRRLNLVGDQYLSDMIDEIETGLTPFVPDSIRASDTLRKTLAERAAEIQADLAGYMGACVNG